MIGDLSGCRELLRERQIRDQKGAGGSLRKFEGDPSHIGEVDSAPESTQRHAHRVEYDLGDGAAARADKIALS